MCPGQPHRGLGVTELGGDRGEPLVQRSITLLRECFIQLPALLLECLLGVPASSAANINLHGHRCGHSKDAYASRNDLGGDLRAHN